MTTKAGKTIYYQECRNPKPDNRGRFHYHPHFKSAGTVSKEDMIKEISKSQWANEPQMRAVFAAIEKLTAEEVSDGKVVHVCGMFIVRVQVRLKKHVLDDGKGTLYVKDFFEGDRIPANEVEFANIDIQPTKAFKKQILDQISGFSHWVGSGPRQNVEDKELISKIDELCETEGYVTVKSIMFNVGLSKDKARKKLNQLVEEGYLRMDKIGHSHLYKK